MLGTKARLVNPVDGFSKRSVLFVLLSGHRYILGQSCFSSNV